MEKLRTITIQLPDEMPEDDKQRIIQGTLARIREEEEREQWFQSEVRRRGLDRRSFIGSLLGL